MSTSLLLVKSAPWVAPASLFEANFDTGVDGTTIAADGSNTAYTGSTRGSGVTATFDNDTFVTAPNSAKLTTPATARQNDLHHAFSFPVAQFSRRVYVFPETTPDANFPFVRISTDGGTIHSQLRFTTARKIEVHNGLTLESEFINELPLFQWSRIEVVWLGGISFTVRLYQGDANKHNAIADFTEERSAVVGSTRQTANMFRVGFNAAIAANQILRLDADRMVHTTGWVGPTVVPMPVRAWLGPAAGRQWLGSDSNAGVLTGKPRV